MVAPAHHCEYQFLLREADIDLVIAEELACNTNFRSWFFGQTGYENASDEAPLFIGRSVSNYHGESDILIVHRDNRGRKRAILIENKIAATPTRAQPERYSIRGEKGIADGEWELFVAVLLAPEKYLTNTTMQFDHKVSYEALLSVFGDESDVRARFKRRLIELALQRAKKPWVSTVDSDLTKWFVDARLFGVTEFPDLPLPEEAQGRAPTNTWILFSLREFLMSRGR